MKPLILATALIAALGATPASAQTTTAPRNPVLGDPGPAPVHRDTRSASQRARDAVRSDRQGPGTTNGNQPDRAAAAAGGR